MAALFLYPWFMPKDNVSYKLLYRNIRKLEERHYEKMYDKWVKILDPDGDLGIAEAELSYEELMWLSDEMI